MDNALFERLLYEEESTTLDFKKEQYPFVKATDEKKSELLKDILGFANAWRRSEAYILIGVDDVRGGRGNVVGILEADHLDDHSLQQFVNNLTNQPVRFHYAAFGFEGKQVGIIRIEEQTRPVYLRRDYGKLLREKVYVRRGSSTDPTKPASPEEIAQMRVGSGQPTAELAVEFAQIDGDDLLGTAISWDAEFCEMPPKETIPDLSISRQRRSFHTAAAALSLDLLKRPNEDFLRELAEFEFARRLFRPVRFVVSNVGQVAAGNVRAELTIPTGTGVMVLDRSGLPTPPKRAADVGFSSLPRVARPAFCRAPGDVEIDTDDARFRVTIDCGDLQPGRRVRSEVFCIGKAASGDLSLCGVVYADNLPQPKGFTLAVSVTVTATAMTVEQLCSLQDPPVQDD